MRRIPPPTPLAVAWPAPVCSQLRETVCVWDEAGARLRSLRLAKCTDVRCCASIRRTCQDTHLFAFDLLLRNFKHLQFAPPCMKVSVNARVGKRLSATPHGADASTVRAQACSGKYAYSGLLEADRTGVEVLPGRRRR